MMQKKIVLILVLLAIRGEILAQYSPFTYSLEKNTFSKTSAENPASNSISDIITIGDTVWIGTSRGVSKSTDRGTTWTNYYNTPAFGTENVSALAYRNGIIWAATAHSVERDGSSFPEGSGLRYSSDGGTTWNAIPQPLDAPGDSIVQYGINNIRALPVTVAINNITYDIALTSNTVWIVSFAGGVRKSTDMGNTWQRVVIPPDYLDSIKPTDTLSFSIQPVSGKFGNENNLNHRVFSVLAVDDQTIYIGTAGGINKSTDGGISWIKFKHLNQENPISGNFVVAMDYNYSSNTVWASTWRAEDQSESNAVSFSADGGQNWQITLEEEKAHNFGFKGAEVLVPTDNGVFRSTDDYNSWIVPTSIIDTETKLSLTTDIFYSADAQDNYLWLGSDNGLVRLDEKGGTWLGDWRIYLASQPLNSISETYAYPNPFSPDVENVKIKYSTNGIRQKVTIRIFDFDMNLTRTVIQNTERGNQIHNIDKTGTVNGVIDYWDGRDEFGNIVPNGVYFYRIDLDSGDPVFGKIMVLM